VDLVFNMNSLAPYSRSSIIFDVDFGNESITIAQPRTALSQKTTFRELHLTTIIQEKNKKIRFGIECQGFNIIDQYLLANKTRVSAVLLKYRLPVEETNIRSAFRLPLSTKHIIKSKILYKNFEYDSLKDFSIRDVSFNGVGIIVPKINNNSNPLVAIKVNEEINFQIILADTDEEDPIAIPIRALVVRVNPRYSERYILMGLQFINLSNQNEAIINKFIYDAQVHGLNSKN